MPRRHRPDRFSRRQLDARLDEVDSLIERKRWVKARDQLQALAQRDPNNIQILGDLLNVYYELHDQRAYLDVGEQLNRLVPNDADLTLALASASMANVRPASALQTFRDFVQQWPEHERAAEVQETLTPVLRPEPHGGEIAFWYRQLGDDKHDDPFTYNEWWMALVLETRFNRKWDKCRRKAQHKSDAAAKLALLDQLERRFDQDAEYLDELIYERAPATED